ncbi:MAG: glycosyltransferase family 4 protein [Deltaproteobacteria bacterium]|nr:glycosyltransferase family 4 protein [Deltaproteobacteria bacterium]
MKKRILLVLTEFPPAIGGMQTHAILLSSHLHKMGYHVNIFTYRSADDPLEIKKVDDSFPFPVYRKLSRVGYHYNLKILTDFIKKHPQDLVYSSTVFYGILEKLTGIKTVCRSVGNDIMRPWIAYPFKPGSQVASNAWLERKLYNFFKKIDKPEMVEVIFREQRLLLTVKSAKSASKILANSEFTRNLLLDVGVPSKNIEVMVGGVDAEYFKRPAFLNIRELRQNLGLPAGRKIITTACRLVDKKGVDFLITSLAATNPQISNMHLVIVGKGRRLSRLRKLAYSMGVDEYVSFVGSVPYEQMPPYYWASDAFVLASTVFRDPVTGLADAETMGRVLLEANAAGTPVVATESGGIPSVISHGVNGLLFQENDVTEFLSRLNELFENDDMRRGIVRNGIKLARDKFDWSHILWTHERVFALENHILSPAKAAAAPLP